MTKAAVLTLIDDLSHTQTDSTAISNFYDEIIADLGQSDILVRASFIQSVVGQGSYSFPAAAIKPLHIFFDSIHLDYELLMALEAINARWRDEVDIPVIWTDEEQSEDNFVVYPSPTTGSGSVASADLGANFVLNSLTVLHTNFESDVPVWLELPIAFTVLAMEYARESDHRDEEYAKMCFGMAELLWSILDIDYVLLRTNKNG